jgi:hypothetical protein
LAPLGRVAPKLRRERGTPDAPPLPTDAVRNDAARCLIFRRDRSSCEFLVRVWTSAANLLS